MALGVTAWSNDACSNHARSAREGWGMSENETITVGGISFSADQVVKATIKIDGRVIDIGKKDKKKGEMGFNGARGGE